MKDDSREGCGYGVVFRGWAKKACSTHDLAYLKGSIEQQKLSRRDVDRKFLDDLLANADGKGSRFAIGKRIMSVALYGVVRLVGGIFWEGKR